MLGFRIFGLTPVTPVEQCAGEAADDLMKRALEKRGCIVSEAMMLPIKSGWLHTFTFRRPRYGFARLGYGKVLHMQISAEHSEAPCLTVVTGPNRGAKIPFGSGKAVVTYRAHCCRQSDGKGFKQWQCETLDELLRSL